MQRVSLLTIGDVHICDHSPGRRTDGYKEAIIAKLEECLQIAKDKKCTHVLFLGDIFHIKAANRVSHRLVQEVGDLLRRFGIPVIILVGNHDITDGSLETLAKQPLGVLRFIPNVTLLETLPVALDDDIDIYPVAGTSPFTIDDFQIQGKNKRDILAVHQSIVPDIKSENEMLRDILHDAALVAEQTNINIVLYGHQHRTDGLYQRARQDGSKVVFSNLGSICRLTINDDDVYKKPAVLVLDILDDADRTVTPEIIMLKNVIDPNDAYKLEDHQEEKDRSKNIDDIIRKLNETEVASFSIDGVITEVENRQDIDQPVRDAALRLLEDVR